MNTNFDEPAVTTVETPSVGSQAAMCFCGEVAASCWWDDAEVMSTVKSRTSAIVLTGNLPPHIKSEIVEEATQNTMVSVFTRHQKGELPEEPDLGWISTVVKRRIIDLTRAADPRVSTALSLTSGKSDKELVAIIDSKEEGAHQHWKREQAKLALNYRNYKNFRSISLDRLMSDRFNDGESDNSGDSLGLLGVEDGEPVALDEFVKFIIEPAFVGRRKNAERDIRMLTAIFEGSQTYDDIARVEGMTQSNLSLIFTAFTKRARELAAKDPEYADCLRDILG